VLAAVALAGCGSGAGAPDADRSDARPDARTPADKPRGAEAPAPAPAPQADHADRADPVAGLSRREQLGALIVLRFAGPELPGYVAGILRDGEAAGVILFGDNLSDPAQARRLTAAIQDAAGGDALVMTDQEGGAVRNLDWVGPERSAPAQEGPDAVRAASRAAGEGLREHGVNVALAPVADAAAPGTPLAGRSFAADPDAASARVAAAVRGWQAGGVGATLKHFPGLGAATANTDDAPATVPGDRATITRRDLAPFAAGIEAGAQLVMIGSARYPALDDERIAMTSPRIVDGLLRDELGFDGVVVTDSLEARAVAAEGSVDEVAVDAVAAGADLALTTGRGSWIRVFRALQDRAAASPAFARRVRESAGRVQRLKDDLARLEE
jgi:beta-N-acetylhexosaminidase